MSQKLRQNEEWLFTGEERLGVARGLFMGRFIREWVMPYPRLDPVEAATTDELMGRLRAFLDGHLDPAAIDRQQDIPREVMDGLAALGIYGVTAPRELGGLGLSQQAYCSVMEELGRRCASTSIFVNVQHSIGMRALLLFGTPEQQQRWLPPLIRGEQLAAFALTEPEAGSDAANVQTRAVPTADGLGFRVSGQKRYITSGALANVLTVMAQTPTGEGDRQAVTAFLVTPDMPGFRVVEARMPKLGIRGTATARLAFEEMFVPRENILGRPGKGLRLALTVLDFGRTTFGACCTGAAKSALELALGHAATRRQFGRTLGEFELIRKKLARMGAYTYAMEAMTQVTAAMIDRGLEDYMLETAMLKVYTTEALWTLVNDAFQIHGGAAYFTDSPLERMLRDARINQIGEGANEALISFIALVGMRGPGLQLKEVWEAMHHPRGHLRDAWLIGLQRLSSTLREPTIRVETEALVPHAQRLSRYIRRFSVALHRALIRHREEVLERQYVQERIAGAAMELFAAACVLSRLDAEWPGDERRHPVGELFLRQSLSRVRDWLAELNRNEDALTTRAALHLLGDGRAGGG